MRKRRLPPLAPLIAAETVARLGSFAAASEELHVTPSAVSHQVRQLESWLGFVLFRRSTRSVALTLAGRQFLEDVSEGLNALEASTAIAMEQAGKMVIARLQTTDSFAARWLVDRLASFQARHPHMSVRVATWEYTEGFRPAQSDLAILYGRGDWSLQHVMPLIMETILPVCSPAVAESLKSRHCKLAQVQLLHDDNLGASWHDWWASAQVASGEYEGVDLRAGLHFNHSHLALRAAEQDSGIVLASWPLVVDALHIGKLVAPFTHRLETGFGYYLVQSPDARIRQRCTPLAEWLQETADSVPLTIPP